jgi:hypothetical protein
VPEKPRQWWSEHWIDVVVAVFTLVGLYIGYKIPISLNEQDSQERLKSERTGRFEADIGLVNQLVSGPLGEEGADNVRAKRAAARAISEYAQQGRVYTPATSILLHYLERESDPKTHCYLEAAIDRGLTIKPPAIGGGARAGDGADLDESNWKTLTTVERTRWQALRRESDAANCLTLSEPTPPGPVPPTPQPKSSEYRQYLDVGCESQNSASGMFVQIDTNLRNQFEVDTATASIQDTSNLKVAQAMVQAKKPDGVLVQYAIVGLDRQVFGNCPGGGHGTLVVQFQLKPKTP